MREPECPNGRVASFGANLVVASILAFGGISDAFAATAPDPLGEQTFFGDLPVVLTVTRLPQNYLDTPASVTVIDRRMIEASGVVDVPDLLRLVAGFQVGHVSGNRTTVTYHGMSDEFARRIQVLVDGRSIYMPANGGVDWADIPLSMEDIDRIEVIRGPNGVAFGANSFMGVVNIITQHASAARGTLAKVQVGDGNYKKVLVREGGKSGDLDYRLTMEYRSDNGYDDVTLNNKLYSQKDDKRSNKISFRGDYRAGINDYLTFGFGINSGPRGQGYNASGNILDVQTQPAFELHNWRHYEQVKWRRIFSSDNELQLNFYHNYTDTQAAFQTARISELFNNPAAPALLGLPDQPLSLQQHIFSERYNAELEHRFRLTDTLRLVWGLEGRFDQVVAEGYLNRVAPIENRLYRAFAHGEWHVRPDYVLNAGAMVEHNDISGTKVSPRIAINHQLAPGHAMRVSYTQAYRTPAVIEQFADYAVRRTDTGGVFDQLWKSYGNLKPERISAYEIGFMGDLNQSRVQYDFKLFQEDIRDLISYPTDLNFTSEPYLVFASYYSGFNQALVFQNLDWARLQGMELQLKLRPDDDTLVSFGFSHVNADGGVTFETNPTNTRPMSQYVPSYTVSVLIDRYFGGGWRGSVALYSIDHMKFWHDASLNTMDMRVEKKFRMGTSEATFALVARDVGNTYFDYQDEISITPRFYGSLEFKF